MNKESFGTISRKLQNIPGGEYTLITFIFVLAYILRLIYILQISHAPYFENPIGDSLVYYNRAIEILKGNLLGKEIYFHLMQID